MTAPAPRPALVIGIGNRFRRDDGAGPAVVERLRAAKLGETVALGEHDGEGAALIETWDGAERVFLVDAARSASEPGAIHRFEAHARALPAAWASPSTHAVGVAAAIELGRVLGRLPPHLVVYAIEGAEFGDGPGLTPLVARAVERLADALREELTVA
jgi:hydrogenase maturation protease